MRFRNLLTLISVVFILFTGCFAPEPSPITVTLNTPQNNSNVPMLTPNFAWSASSTATSFTLQVATDSNFQGLVLNESGITQAQYQMPGNVLRPNQTYYWRVSAIRNNQTSGWSQIRTFQTGSGTEKGSISVNVLLDGSAWSGSMNFTITGEKKYTGSTVPADFNNVTADTYSLTYNYSDLGGMATLTNITPSPTQELSAGGHISFTLNFHRQSSTSIYINATLNGQPWSGQVDYTINGPVSDSSSSVPDNLTSIPTGNYTLIYNGGGPSGAILAGITPSPTQKLSTGGAITFTLNFNSQTSTSVIVNAVVDGAPWSGRLNYTLRGPFSTSHSSVPDTYTNVPPGTYTVTYNYGGPPDAVLTTIMPAPTQNLPAGGTISFTLYFQGQASGTIAVNATLDGAPWSGPVNYTITGPYTESGNAVPASSRGRPAGDYTFTYNYGGPQNAVLVNVTPSPYQSLITGGTIKFTMNFRSQQSFGSIIVNATLNGKPWSVKLGSGSIKYSIIGPKSDSSDTVPQTFSRMPAGQYTLSYNSGGPIGSQLQSITPEPTQVLQPNGTIAFTMNFSEQARGLVIVNATLDGKPWSGTINYVLNGPYVESAQQIPHTFSSAPAGTYSVQYRSGAPHGTVFSGVQPAQQHLAPGGQIAFTIMFTSTPMPGPVPKPEPIPGPIPEPESEPLLK